MNKELFIEGLEAIVDYVARDLKKDIEYQFDSFTIGEDYWGNNDAHCNIEVALSHLKIANDFLRGINVGGEADQKVLDNMYYILYEETYYDFDVVEIIEDYDYEIDSMDFDKTLISYLKGEISLDDLEDDEKK